MSAARLGRRRPGALTNVRGVAEHGATPRSVPRFVADGQFVAPLRTAAGKDLAAVLGGHALTKTVGIPAFPLVRLKSTVHCFSLVEKISPKIRNGASLNKSFLPLFPLFSR